MVTEYDLKFQLIYLYADRWHAVINYFPCTCIHVHESVSDWKVMFSLMRLILCHRNSMLGWFSHKSSKEATDSYSFSVFMLLFGWQEGHPTC